MTPLRAFALLLVAACASERPATPAADSTTIAPAPRDSLALIVPRDSTHVWLTPGRTGTAADGTTCHEYGVRVGAAGAERLVPLLFVREAPRVDAAGRLLATLSTNCVDGAAYEINPVTAQPKLVRKVDR